MNALPAAVATIQTAGQGHAGIVIYLLRPEFVAFSSGKPCVTAAERRAGRTHNGPRVEPGEGLCDLHTPFQLRKPRIKVGLQLQLTQEPGVELIWHVDNHSPSVNTSERSENFVKETEKQIGNRLDNLDWG